MENTKNFVESLSGTIFYQFLISLQSIIYKTYLSVSPHHMKMAQEIIGNAWLTEPLRLLPQSAKESLPPPPP